MELKKGDRVSWRGMYGQLETGVVEDANLHILVKPDGKLTAGPYGDLPIFSLWMEPEGLKKMPELELNG